MLRNKVDEMGATTTSRTTKVDFKRTRRPLSGLQLPTSTQGKESASNQRKGSADGLKLKELNVMPAPVFYDPVEPTIKTEVGYFFIG